MWSKNRLYHKIPTGKKSIGDSLYGGVPNKYTIAMEGHNDVA
jgi:hypothetical protein